MTSAPQDFRSHRHALWRQDHLAGPDRRDRQERQSLCRSVHSRTRRGPDQNGGKSPVAFLDPVTLKGRLRQPGAVVAGPSRRAGRRGARRRTLEALVHRDPRARWHEGGNRTPSGPAGKGTMLPFTVLDASGIPVGHDHLYEYRRAQPAAGDRFHLVPPVGAARPAQHRMQVAASHPRFRDAGLYRGGIPHPCAEQPEPPRHRAAGRQAGRHPAPPSDPARSAPSATARSTASRRRNGRW